MMQIVLSMAPLPSLGQGIRNKVQHDFFGNVTPLALTSAAYGTDGMIYGTTEFLT